MKALRLEYLLLFFFSTWEVGDGSLLNNCSFAALGLRPTESLKHLKFDSMNDLQQFRKTLFISLSCFFSLCFPQGCLPLVLMFDIKEDIEVEPQCITSLMEQLDVFISVKPKPKQPSKVCTLTKTYTCNITYGGRHHMSTSHSELFSQLTVCFWDIFAITFNQPVSRWFLVDEWSQFSSVSNSCPSRGTTGVVHHIKGLLY